jgi:hypothetical protein
MKTSLLRELTLYQYRYVICYVLFVFFLFGLLLTDIGSIPNGISRSEMNSTIASNSLNPLAPRAEDVINLPYHLLQKLSVGLFGLSPLSIRLPSIILAFMASIVLAFTLHQWFRKGIAIVTLLIGTASVPFISMGRMGTASVLYMLLLLIILLGAVKLTTRGRRTFLWKVVVGIAGLLLFYMPLGIYAVLAIMIAGIFHPHVRYQIKRTKWWQFLLLLLAACVLLAPLLFAGITDNETLEVLFGVDALKEKLTLTSLWASVLIIVKTLFVFSKPETGEIITPFLSLTFMLLVIFGLIRTLFDRHAARSYLLLIWLSISIPLLILNPTQFALLFVPCLILMAVGLETFMREWYQLFPRNPYARIGALVPLSLIVISLVTIAATRYFYGYYYTDTSSVYHPELAAVRQVIKPHINTQLVVPENQVAFYDILRSKYPLLTVASAANAGDTASQQIVLNSAGSSTEGIPDTIITSHLAHNGVLLRTYDQTQ